MLEGKSDEKFLNPKKQNSWLVSNFMQNRIPYGQRRSWVLVGLKRIGECSFFGLAFAFHLISVRFRSLRVHVRLARDV